ncbi:PIN-like domain-containing protein [Myxococcota bacterium]|nr:PIN-like domain-containing protein [Myxococcota bacterium]
MLGETVFPMTEVEYRERLRSALAEPSTLVFVDTNVLAFPYRLFEGARKELLEWFEDLANTERLWVPAWAANEYFTRSSASNLREYLPTLDLPSVITQLERQLEFARLSVNDSNTIAGLEEAIAKLTGLKTTMRIKKQRVELSEIHTAIQKAFGERVLTSDISSLCERVGAVAAQRMQHRLPPGFKDAGKEVNAYGDLILWREIIEFCRGLEPKPTKTLLITNDQKRDWSYAPTYRLRTPGSDRIEDNERPSLHLTDPRLVREFQAGIGSEDASFEVASIGDVVAALSDGDPTRFRLLATALQILSLYSGAPAPVAANGPGDGDPNASPAGDAPLPVPNAAEPLQCEPSQPPVEPQPVAPEPDALAIGDAARADGQYQPADHEEGARRVLIGLRSHNWHAQNPVVGSILSLPTEQTSIDSWFVIGRNVYQAACGNAFRAIAFLERLSDQLHHLSNSAADALVSGMAFEVYFGSDGSFRGSDFKVDYLSYLQPMVQARPVVRRFLNVALQPHLEAIAVPPWEVREFAFSVTCVKEANTPGWNVTSLAFAGKAVFQGAEAVIGGKEADISQLLQRRYAIPATSVVLNFDPAESRAGWHWIPSSSQMAAARELFHGG